MTLPTWLSRLLGRTAPEPSADRLLSPENSPPDRLALLADARQRQINCDGLLRTLDRAHERMAAKNPALTATEAGCNWFEVWARTNVARGCTSKELDALLDGDFAEAERNRKVYHIVVTVLPDYVTRLESSIDDVLHRGG